MTPRLSLLALVVTTSSFAATPVASLFVSEAPPVAIYHDGWIDFNKNGVKDPYEDPTLATDVRVADLVARMTPDEKTAQMVTLYGFPRVLKDELPTPAWKQAFWKDGIGNIDEHMNGNTGWTDCQYPSAACAAYYSWQT